jgi:hypothetical protein
MKVVDFQPESAMQYLGQSDLIAQVIYELKNKPNSCMAINLLSWYNALYSASPNDTSCLYQVQTKPVLISDLVNNRKLPDIRVESTKTYNDQKKP